MPTPTLDEGLAYKVETTARLLDCSRAFVYKLIAEGRLRTVKIGRSRRVPRQEIERLLGDAA